MLATKKISEVFITMMLSERYSRQINLKDFGAEGQQKLLQAKVLVVGAGGLGVPVLQYLAAMGVGTIGIIDGDTIGLANLNRQVLYTENEVGRLKTEVAREKLLQQNPSIKIQAFPAFLDAENAIDIIGNFDIIIDATDTFGARYLINDACVILVKPFVYGAVQGFEGHVSVFNFKDGPTYRCLYPDFPSPNEIPDCNTAGILGIVPGIIGCYQALEAVKIITGIGETISGYLQIFDFLNNDQYKVKLKARPENKSICSLKNSYENSICSTVKSITANELFKWFTENREFSLIDVREMHEFENMHLESSIHYPLSAFNVDISDISSGLPLVAICAKGERSLKAASIIQEKNLNSEVFSLQGGMDEWVKEIGNKFIVS